MWFSSNPTSKIPIKIFNLNGHWKEQKGWPHFLIISKASIKINKHKKLEEM